MARQTWEYITEDATSVDDIRTLKSKVHFTYFNPNGAYAAKCASDERIAAAVDAGKCKSGAHFAYGDLNDFHYKNLVRFATNKRVRRFDVFYTIRGLLEDVAKADKFLERTDKT